MWRAIPVHENLTLWWGPCLRNSGCHFHPSSTHFSRVPVAWEALYTIASVKGSLFILETFSFFITLRFPPAFVSVSSLSPHCEKICKKGSILKGPEGRNRCRFHRAGSLTEPVVFHPGGLCPQAISQRAHFKLTFSLQWPISLEISTSLCSRARKEMLKVDSWKKQHYCLCIKALLCAIYSQDSVLFSSVSRGFFLCLSLAAALFYKCPIQAHNIFCAISVNLQITP